MVKKERLNNPFAGDSRLGRISEASAPRCRTLTVLTPEYPLRTPRRCVPTFPESTLSGQF